MPASKTGLFDKSNEVFITLDQRHGLGQPAVLSMARDNLGYTWVGTQSGLNRYDGYKFSQFNDKGSPLADLAGTYISSLCTTPNNILWIGTRSGISSYNYQTGQTKVITTENSKILSNKISSLSCSNNKVTAGSYENGFFSIDSHSGQVIPNSISKKIPVGDLIQTTDYIYAASASGLYRQDKQSYEIEKVLSERVFTLTSYQGWLFIAASDGSIRRYSTKDDFKKADWQTVVNEGPYKAINSMVVLDNSLWVASKRGLHRYDFFGQLQHHYTHRDGSASSIADNNILSLKVIDQHTLWIGTASSGLSHLNLSSRQLGHINHDTYGNEKFVNHDMRSFAIDVQNRMWLGSSQGLYISQNGRVILASELYPKLNMFDLAFIADISFFDGELWLTTFGDGVIRYNFDSQKLTRYFTPKPKQIRRFIDLERYRGEIITVARHNGIFRFDRKRQQLVPMFENAKTPIPKSIYEIQVIDGDIWAGSLGDGLLKIQDGQVQQFAKQQGAPSNMVYTVIESDNGLIWASTDAGIVIVDKNLSLKATINKQTGLANEAVWTLVKDQQGYIWAGTSGGLSRINPIDYTVTNFSVLDGAQGLEYNFGAATLTNEGFVVIGGSNGFNYFDPTKITLDSTLNAITLSQITVLGQTVSPKATPEIAQQEVEFLQEIDLNYQQDILSFKYTSLNSSAQRVEYYYRVLGLSDNWIKMNQDSRQFNLMKLPPGKYTIEAYAKNDNGFSSPIHRLAVNLAAPWWWNLYSKTLYLFIICGLLMWFYHIRQQVLRNLEAQVVARTEQLSKKNEKLETAMAKLKHAQSSLVESEKMAALGGLVAGVAHEINTPLSIVKTAVSHNKDAIVELTKLVEDKALTASKLDKSLAGQSEAYTLMRSNLERAIHLISTFKQVAVDQSTEALREIELTEYIKEIMLAVHPLLRNKNIELRIEGEDNIKLQSYPGPLYQILTNLVNNSITHGFEGRDNGEILIEVVRKTDTATIYYRDNGNGIDQAIIEQVYEPFITTKRNEGGSGLGMHIVYNLITQLFKGSIDCKSPQSGGVLFTIELPYSPEKTEAIETQSILF
ncbi:MAG: ATP-binding protein [Psychrobium sp.]